MSKKIIFIFLFFILFLIFINNKSFATIQIEYNNTTYEIPDFPSGFEQYDYRLAIVNTSDEIVNNRFHNIVYFGSFGELYLYNNNNGSYRLKSRSSSGYGKQTCQRNGNATGYIMNDNFSTSTGYYTFNSNNWAIVYSNFTVVYNDGTNDNIFYQPPTLYENFPFFLNDKESISIGGQTLIVQPRRF